MELENLPVRNIDKKWEKYNLYTGEVFLGEQDTGKRLIFRNREKDGFVAMVSNRYQLLPNEEALRMANEIATRVGFTQNKVYYSSDGNYMNATFLSTSNKGFSVDVNESHTDINEEEQRARQSLKDAQVGTETEAMKEHYMDDHTWEHKTDEVQFGFSIHNSIDGSSGFGAGSRGHISTGYDKGHTQGYGFRLFTLRKVCMNGAIVRSSLFSNYLPTVDERFKIDTKRIELPAIRASVRHIASNEEKFMESVVQSLGQIQRHLLALSDIYKRWTILQMDKDFAERMIKLLPQKYLPETIQVKNGKLTDEELYKSLTVWEAFNQVTEGVWHNEKLDIRRKAELTDKLHEALYTPVVQGVTSGATPLGV